MREVRAILFAFRLSRLTTHVHFLPGAITALPIDRATLISGTGFSGKASLTDRFGTVESLVSTARVNAQSDAAIRNSQADTISSRLAADGVDSDAEMQRLLRYEQAYAANARVIQAIQTMMDQILGI